ncbi:hypothetical protein F-VV10_0162 [Faustovirus]|nr:hypothetical protein F-VV10_0162 [Faustovirus]
MSTIRRRVDYITQLPPEILTIILRDCDKWFKPRINRGRVMAKDVDEIAITRAIIGAIASTCKYFNAIVRTIEFNFEKPPCSQFVLHNSHAFKNLLKIASIDFVKTLLRERKVSSLKYVKFTKKKSQRISVSNPIGLQVGLINHVVSEGPSDVLMEIRRMGLLANYAYNSISFSALIDKPNTVCYAARYRRVEDVYDLNRNVEGIPPMVATRVVNKWIKYMHDCELLQQTDLNKALNLIIRTHPDHCQYVFNYILRMQCHVNKQQRSRCYFLIDDNELALYAMYRGGSEYSRFLMTRLSTERRIKVMAMLPLNKDKYIDLMTNWDLQITPELMNAACNAGNRGLADFCKSYASYCNENDRAQLNAIYSRRFCVSGGGCCTPSNYGSYNYNSITLAQNNNTYGNSGLCYTSCPSGYNYSVPRIGNCACDSQSTSFMSFVQYPDNYQPSGSLNMSRMNTTFTSYNNDPGAQFFRYPTTSHTTFFTAPYPRIYAWI